jgi:hypothetical protein
MRAVLPMMIDCHASLGKVGRRVTDASACQSLSEGTRVIDCPYCAETIKAEALVCPHCRGDIAALRPWIERVQALEAKLARYEAPPPVAVPAATTRPRPRRGSPVATFLWLVVLPIVLLLVAHGVIILWLDLNNLVMRGLAILIPLPFGIRRPRSKGVDFAIAATVAVVSVALMSVATGLHDQVPVLPQNGQEWREVGEYALSILLSYATGMLLARWLFSPTKGREPKLDHHMRKLLAMLVHSTRGEDETDDALAARVHLAEDRVRTLIGLAQKVAPLVSAIGSYAFGINSPF